MNSISCIQHWHQGWLSLATLSNEHMTLNACLLRTLEHNYACWHIALYSRSVWYWLTHLLSTRTLRCIVLYCCYYSSFVSTDWLPHFFAQTKFSPHASKVLILALSVTFLFFCLWIKYLWNGWTDLHHKVQKFFFLAPAHPGGPGKRAVKRLSGVVFRIILCAIKSFMYFRVPRSWRRHWRGVSS